MSYRKYDTCFFERYAMLSLRCLLGHKFDDLFNEDRPDLQSADHHSLGIEVTRAMEGGRDAARKMLKNMAGITPCSKEDSAEIQKIIDSGYGYGIQEGRYVGGLELDYWKSARPLRDIIRSKVWKVNSGFYGSFDEFGLFVFCKDTLSEPEVADTVRFIMEAQAENEKKYRRLYLSYMTDFYACNLDDDISFEYRVTHFPVSKDLCREFYFDALEY